MKKIAIVWTLIILIIIGGLTVIGLNYKNNHVDSINEESLVKMTEKYFGLYPNLFPAKGKDTKITSDELISEGYDPEFTEDCTGYVIVKNKDMGFKYIPYVKCPSYTTEGYEE